MRKIGRQGVIWDIFCTLTCPNIFVSFLPVPETLYLIPTYSFVPPHGPVV